jgi:hypothetical protein
MIVWRKFQMPNPKLDKNSLVRFTILGVPLWSATMSGPPPRTNPRYRTHVRSAFGPGKRQAVSPHSPPPTKGQKKARDGALLARLVHDLHGHVSSYFLTSLDSFFRM